MRRNSLAFRLVAGAAVWCALWLSAGGYGLSALFGNTVERSFDARLGVLLEGLVAGSELKPDGWLDLRRQLGEPRIDLFRQRTGRVFPLEPGQQPACGLKIG